MLQVRRATERGHANHGWLDARHTFSFAGYHDPEQMGFRSLRVMNEDRIQPGQGFGTHPHHDMEIVTYVMEGMLEHRDSLGNGSVLRPGELQRISAGSGITHSEFNPSPTAAVHLYQLWIVPNRLGIPPSYQQQAFDGHALQNQLRLVASPHGAEDSLAIQQDVRIYLGRLDRGQSVHHPLATDRHAWLQVLQGRVRLDSVSLETSDGVAVSDQNSLPIHATDAAEIMLFDLA